MVKICRKRLCNFYLFKVYFVYCMVNIDGENPIVCL